MKGKSDDNWKIDEKLVLPQKEVNEMDDMLREGVDREFMIAQRRNGIRQRLIRWDRTEVVPFMNGTAIKVSYCRQYSNNPPVEVRQYQIGDDDKMHYITISYRQSEKDLWLPYWETIKKTIKFIR